MATIPAHENEFPSLLFAEGAAPATPAAGLVICYAKADGLLYCKDDAGVETAYAAASAALAAHLADTADAHDASAISVADAGAVFTGTDVEAVLAELQAAIAGGGISPTIVDAKGDLIAGTADDTVVRLAVGTNGYGLVADSAQSTGLAWVNHTLQTYTPTWTASSVNPAIGNGTITGHWQQIAHKLYWVNAVITMGSTTTYGTGTWEISLPFTAKATDPAQQLLTAVFIDTGTASRAGVARVFASGTKTTILVSADGSGSNHVTSSVPHTWANTDILIIHGILIGT